MIKIKRQLFTLCLWLALMAVNAQTMTLGECIQLGIERNLQLGAQRIDIKKGETQIRQSRALLLPQVNGSIQVTDYLKNPVQVSGGTLLGMDYPDPINWQKVHTMPYGSQAMLQAQMPLYNQSIYEAIQAAKVVKRLNELSYDKACETLKVQIAKCYFLAQACQEHVLLLGEDVKRMTELRDITEALLEQGIIIETDFTRIKINITNLETQQRQYDMVLNQQLNTLRFLLDLNAEDSIAVTRMEKGLIQVASRGVSNALPDQLLLDTQQQLISRQVRLTRAGYLPSLGLFAQAGYLGYQEKFGDFFKHFNNRQFGMAAVGLQLNIPIFDGNDRRHKIQQYRLDADKVAINRELLDSSIEKDYRNASLQLSQNEQIYSTQCINRQQALDVYNVTFLRYREGVGSMADLLLDDMRIISTEQEVVNAQLQYHLALVDILRLENNLDALK